MDAKPLKNDSLEVGGFSELCMLGVGRLQALLLVTTSHSVPYFGLGSSV